MTTKIKVPSVRRHVSSGQARVRVNGRDIYLGPWGSEEAERRYRSIVSESLTTGTIASVPGIARRVGCSLTLTELIIRYVEERERLTGPEALAESFKPTLRRLRVGFGQMPAADFGPRELREL